MTGIRGLVVAGTLVVACGCGGEDYEHVTYDKPQPPPQVVVDVGHLEWDAASPKRFVVPDLKSKMPVLFKGTVTLPPEPLRLSFIHFKFLSERPGRKPVTRGARGGRPTQTDDGWAFEVQLDAPQPAGNYAVQVEFLAADTEASEGQQARIREVARSTVRVR